MSEPEFPAEEEEDFLDSETDSETDSDDIEVGDDELFLEDGDDDYDLDRNAGRTRVNARRALEDYFEEKSRREEENYFDDFNIPLDDD